jgi:hypothetical protein
VPVNMPFKSVKPAAAPGTPTDSLGKPPAGLGSAIRAVARPPIAPTGDTGAKPPANIPTTRLNQRPLPTKLPSQNTVKLTATPPPKTGPKGTQKLTE